MRDGLWHAEARLAGLPPEDRQWLYGQLSAEERSRLFEILSSGSNGESDGQETAEVRRTEFSPTSAEEYVAAASPWQIAQAMLDEPDWMAALILSRRSWPWGAEYLSGLDGDRAHRLRALAASIGESSREKTYMAAIKGLALKIERMASTANQHGDPEGEITRLMGFRPMDD